MLKKSFSLLLTVMCFSLPSCKKNSLNENLKESTTAINASQSHPSTFSLKQKNLPVKVPFIFAHFSSFSFLDQKDLITEILSQDISVDNLSNGPFPVNYYDDSETKSSWIIKGLPSAFVWYSSENINGTESFMITDSVGMPLKAFIKNISAQSETMSFLIINDSLQENKKYYLYFKKKNGSNVDSWIQPFEIKN